MKITPELFKRWNGENSDDIKSMEFLDAIKSQNIPEDLCHYISTYYILTQEEYKAYCEYCGIENSENFWYSNDIKNSKNIYSSTGIINSIFIRNSDCVFDSKDIYNSQNITTSEDIAHSYTIARSKRILESQAIYDSIDIARSNNIEWSWAILNSNHLKECTFTYKSDNLVDCHFCGFMRNSRHCLFCVGLENKEYYIFNQPVSQLEYEQTIDKLLALTDQEISSMIKINVSKHTAEERFKLNKRFDNVFNGLSSSFYGWIGTLPNYSDNVFVDLFFRDREEVLKTDDISQ